MFHALLDRVGARRADGVGSKSISKKDLIGFGSVESEPGSQFGNERAIVVNVEFAADGGGRSGWRPTILDN